MSASADKPGPGDIPKMEFQSPKSMIVNVPWLERSRKLSSA